MKNLDLDILVEEPRWLDVLADCEQKSQAAVYAALAYCEISAMCGELELSITLSNDAHVQELNRDYRGKDKPTNVLSFPVEEFDDAGFEQMLAEYKKRGQPFMLGDIVLALETVEREAVEQAKDFSNHVTHLLVHGVLHLLGYDHMEDAPAQRMEAKEQAILKTLGVDDPYLIEE